MKDKQEKIDLIHKPPMVEPSIEEQLAMETKNLENQVQDLTFKLINSQNENSKLIDALAKQETNFNTIIAKMICDIYGR